MARTRVAAAVLASLLLAAAAGPALAGGPARRGHLVLIGGGDKPQEAMSKFIELAGGKDAPIVALPTASSEPDAAAYYEGLFRETYGCTRAVSLDVRTRADADRADWAALARNAKGIFFGGGDQIRITTALLGTPVGDAIAAAFAAGAVVGGTSAGTACQSEVMITGEGDFSVVAARCVETSQGLGFLPEGVLVDQHFLRRGRQNRLLSLVLECPELLGVGVDEATAAWFRPDGTFEVLGQSAVMVLDARDAVVSRAARDGGQDALGVHGLTVHILLPGDAYDTRARTVLPRRGTP
ncbi:cyanophycinase [Acidobacteria bacterium ACD]|nr:MAG: cyanophycinase [Acidobacteriota bacterium]MDL1948607.1 cyanophycinase [Acidobacteria bacterium ACD]